MAQEKDICRQYNKETDTIENFHDIDIAKGTQQTTMAQTGCVQGWDANGNAIFIPRDSVLQILSEVINANSQSSITTLFGMNGSGDQATPAAINMANLASVLGALCSTKIRIYGNANDYEETLIATAMLIQNTPSEYGVLVVIKSLDYVFQFWLGRNNKLYMRSRNYSISSDAWTTWAAMN